MLLDELLNPQHRFELSIASGNACRPHTVLTHRLPQLTHKAHYVCLHLLRAYSSTICASSCANAQAETLLISRHALHEHNAQLEVIYLLSYFTFDRASRANEIIEAYMHRLK